MPLGSSTGLDLCIQFMGEGCHKHSWVLVIIRRDVRFVSYVRSASFAEFVLLHNTCVAFVERHG